MTMPDWWEEPVGGAMTRSDWWEGLVGGDFSAIFFSVSGSVGDNSLEDIVRD